jgi:nitrate/nitrite-specific signal transduction histidine kinase
MNTEPPRAPEIPQAARVHQPAVDNPMQRQPQHETEPRLDRPSPAWEEDRNRLEQEVRELKAEQQRFLECHMGLEEQNSTLTTLYVACQRLHSTLDRAEVLLAAREIITNLVGCEEYALFSTVPTGLLRCVDSFGIDPEEGEKFCLSTEILWRVLQTGEPYLSQGDNAGGRTGAEARISACIPLKLNGTVTGAIALFRFLPQKPGLQKLDEELFQLLENHLALALHCTDLHEKWTQKNGAEA